MSSVAPIAPAASAWRCTASASSSTQDRSAVSEPRSVRAITVRARSGPASIASQRRIGAMTAGGNIATSRPRSGTTKSGEPSSPCVRSRSSRSPRTVGSDSVGTRLSTIATVVLRSTASSSTRQGRASP